PATLCPVPNSPPLLALAPSLAAFHTPSSPLLLGCGLFLRAPSPSVSQLPPVSRHASVGTADYQSAVLSGGYCARQCRAFCRGNTLRPRRLTRLVTLLPHICSDCSDPVTSVRQKRIPLWFLLSLCVSATTWLYVHQILSPWADAKDLQKGGLKAQMWDLYPRWVGGAGASAKRTHPYGPEV